MFHVLYDRRRTMLDAISALPICTGPELIPRMFEQLRLCERDIPMTIFYSADDEGIRHLETCTGVRAGQHPAAPTELLLFR